MPELKTAHCYLYCFDSYQGIDCATLTVSDNNMSLQLDACPPFSVVLKYKSHMQSTCTCVVQLKPTWSDSFKSNLKFVGVRATESAYKKLLYWTNLTQNRAP